MTQPALAAAVRNVRAALAAGGPSGPGDRELLHAFAERRDSSAFTAIVRRYGPLVVGVCRRELGHEQDAEDAFQATFLVLARKPSSVRKGESLACWLYGTARRVALRAKRDAARRRAREARAGRKSPPDPVDELTWREVREALEEEVRRLPATYRDAFVLCCLEGVAHAEVARWLGRSPGTVSSQVSRARERLRGRLARRGIELSLAVGALAVESAGRAAVPAGLATATAELGTACAAGQLASAGLSARALSLADGALRGVPAARTGLAAVLLLGVGLLGAGAAAYCRGSASAGELPAPAAGPAGKAAASGSKPAGEATTTLSGRVLGPDGKPVKGAQVALWSGGKLGPRATTDAEGRFRLAVGAKQVAGGAKVIARAEGLGPDWADVGGKSKELTLRLVKDDVPITGRILDLEGKPVAGVSVEAEQVGRVAGGGGLGGWLDRNARMRKEGRYLNGTGLEGVPAGALGLRAVTTDEGGRFRLGGIGRDRVARLLIRGDTVEHARLWAATRPGPRRGWVTGPFPVYAAEFDHVAPPAKPIVGTVRDRRTRKPLAGIVVEGGPSMHAGTTTDARGRFRLLGIAKSHGGYWLSAGGGPGRPYFDVTRSGIADTPGLKPITVDVELERGVEITGRVTDKVTGKPVPGRVMYFHTPDNPNVKDYVTLDVTGKVLVSDWGRIGPDGSFTVLGIPGPGVLAVCAEDETGFPIVDARKELARRKIRSAPARPAHAIISVDVVGKDPRTRKVDITLDPGRARAGSVAGPDGKPLAGVRAAGLTVARPPQKLTTPRFALRGMGARNVYLLIFVQEEDKLGKAQVVRGDEKGPVQVRLEPLGALAGRLVEGGRPLGGRYVRVFFATRGREYDNLPLEGLNRAGVFGLAPGAWYGFTSRLAKTDKDGRFRIDGLIGGARYWLAVAEGRELSAPLRFLTRGGKPAEVSAGPGKTKDLGDVEEGSFR